MKITALAFAVSVMIQPAFAQDVTAVEKATDSAKKTTASEARAERMLHRAYWLDRVEKKRSEALVLYKSFLAAAPKHEAAPRAAAYALVLVRRTSRRDAAAFSKQYAMLLEKVDADVQEEIEDQGRRGRGRGFPGRGGRGRDGGGRGGPGGDRFGRGRRGSDRGRDGGRDGDRGRGRNAAVTNPLTARMPVKLPDMTKEQVTAFLARYGKVADEYVATLRKSKETKKADELAKAVSQIKTLISAAKLAEAQSAIDKMQRGQR
jgi:hypothetical protein